MQIGVIGAGSIGGVLAQGFDQLGHDVVINDRDKTREAELEFEAQPKEWIAANADFVVIAVPTPTTEIGGDASAVDEVLAELGPVNGTIIIRSTMPPGETQRLAEKHGIQPVYSPEFLRDRSDVDDFFHPDRIVLAGPEDERMRVLKLMSHWAIDCDRYIQFDDYLTAEIGKEAHNSYFATKVSFANEMRLICEETGADVQGVMDIVTADSRNTTSHLDPTLGPYGGKCLPKDLAALKHFGKDADADVALLQAVEWVNDVAREEFDNVEITGNWPQVKTVGDD